MAVTSPAVIRPLKFGVVGPVLLASATVGEALANWCEFMELTPTCLSAEIVGTRYRWELILSPRMPVRYDALFADALTMFRTVHAVIEELSGVACRFDAIDCPWSDDAASGCHLERLASTVRFGADRLAIQGDAGILDCPVASFDAEMLEVALAQCRALLDSYRRQLGLRQKIAEFLLRTPSSPMRLEDVAAALALAPRTVQRRLAEEGTTFAEVVAQVRLARVDMFDRTALSVKRAAYLAGYHSVSSIYRSGLRRPRRSA